MGRCEGRVVGSAWHGSRRECTTRRFKVGDFDGLDVLRTDIRIIVPGRRRGDRMGERMVIRFSTLATLSALFRITLKISRKSIAMC